MVSDIELNGKSGVGAAPARDHLSFAFRTVVHTDPMDHLEDLRKLVGPAAKDWQDADFEEANENLRQYVAIALRIFERLELDEKERDRVASLTTPRTEGTINAKGRENNQK